MTAQATETQEKKPFFAKRVADQLARQLRDGKAPMQSGDVQSIPYNPCTGRAYHGINSLNLMMQGRRDDRWMTFDEANNAGYKIKEGEKATPVQYWAKKQPGEEKNRTQTTYLFNGDQLQFIPPMQRKPDRPEPYERVSDILKDCGAAVVHDQKSRSFYNAAKDEIHLPPPDSYKNLDSYCQDALNAYFHSTGHPSRENRETFASSKRYQQNTEELVCAVATMTMCAELGIPNNYTKNAELAVPWAENMEKFPIQFSQAMQATDDAVWRTLRQEQTRNMALNPENDHTWRPVAEASPAMAVKTFLAQKDVLSLAETAPEKVYAFDHDDTQVFTKPGAGIVLSKKEIESPGMDGTTFAMKVKTEGYDKNGQTYDVIMTATVRQNESGLFQPVAPPEAERVNLNTRDMALPLEWNGKVDVSPCHEDESGNFIHGHSEEYQEFYGAFAQCEGREEVLLASFSREKQAQYYASLVEKQLAYQQERPQQQRQAAPEQQAARQEQQAEQTASPARPEPEPDREQLRQTAKEKVAERLTEERMDADKAAQRVAAMAKRFTVPTEPTPYMQAKGVDLIPGVLQNKTSTCIPLYNIDGKLRSMAYADKDGKTNYAKGTERNGCAFYDKKAVEKSPVVGFAVGVATAATVSQVFKGVPVVATMDAANLPVVAAAFKEKYPNKEQIIFADRTLGKDNGQDHAKQAAEKTGAKVLTPRFASNEKTSDFSTFNDLAVKSTLGKEAVKEQCESAVEKAKKMASEKAQEQAQEKSRSDKELAR